MERMAKKGPDTNPGKGLDGKRKERNGRRARSGGIRVTNVCFTANQITHRHGWGDGKEMVHTTRQGPDTGVSSTGKKGDSYDRGARGNDGGAPGAKEDATALPGLFLLARFPSGLSEMGSGVW